jgi:hypothetical protein
MEFLVVFLLSLVRLCLAAGINSSTTCGRQCQFLAAAGSSYEVGQHAEDSYSFYVVPSNFSTKLAPGVLLTVEVAVNMSNYSVPSPLSMSRIIYTTSDLNGTTIPASAYILWPYSPLESSACPDQGYPMVAWAHGTSGLLKACAPSNYRNLQYHFMTPFLLALQGIAVVAPDYAGLGVASFPSSEEISHPWLAGPAQANDLAHAVTAARTAFPDLLNLQGPFVAMGHSQWGGAAWAFAERQASQPLRGYKGTIAIAPPTRVFEQLEQALANTSLPYAGISLGIPPKLIAAVTAAFPAYNYSGLTDLSYDRWHNVLRPLQGCLPTDALVFSDITPDRLAKPDWQRDPTVQQYAKMTEVGGKKFKGPLLVLAGELDSIVSLTTIESAVDDTCNMANKHKWGESLEMIIYKGVDHFPLIQASQGRWLDWVKERLDSRPSPRAGCTKKSVKGLRSEFAFQSITPNFLEAWVDVNESWKYLL